MYVFDTSNSLHQIYATNHLQHEPAICTTQKCHRPRSRCLKISTSVNYEIKRKLPTEKTAVLLQIDIDIF